MHYVYHLIDPNDRTVRYVGKSANPRSRLLQHIRESREKQNTAKKAWINSLLKTGQRPVLVIAGEYSTDDRAREMESHNVHLHRATILNIHDPAKGAKDLHKQKGEGG